jgi:hypothetical protein
VRTDATVGCMEDERHIKEIVARRAEELGARVSPRDVRLEFMEGEAAPGCRLFHASWGAGRHEGWLSGLVQEGEPADTYPAQALAKVFRRWTETAGGLPDARLAARVAAYVFDPAGRHEAILGAEDMERLVERAEWLPHVTPPALIEVEGRPGVAFWWTSPRGVSEMRFHFDGAGRIRASEKFIQDFLQGGGAEAAS